MSACWLVSAWILCSAPVPLSLSACIYSLRGPVSALKLAGGQALTPEDGDRVFWTYGSLADHIEAQAGRAKRGISWVAILGTLWASFPGFASWPCLEVASPLSFMWAVRWICSRRNGFQDGFPFIAQTPGTSGLPGLFFSALCIHAAGLLCTGAYLITSTTKWVALATISWQDSKCIRNCLEKHQMRI